MPKTVLSTPGLSVYFIPDNTEIVRSTPENNNAPILDLNNQDPKIQHIPADSNPHGTTTPTPMPSPYLIPNDNNTDVILSTTGPPDDFHLSTNPFGPSTAFTLCLKENHPTVGLNFIEHPDNSCIKLQPCSPSTPAAHISRW